MCLATLEPVIVGRPVQAGWVSRGGGVGTRVFTGCATGWVRGEDNGTERNVEDVWLRARASASDCVRVSASEDRLAGRYLQGFKWSVQVQQQQRENASRVGKREEARACGGGAQITETGWVYYVRGLTNSPLLTARLWSRRRDATYYDSCAAHKIRRLGRKSREHGVDRTPYKGGRKISCS